MHLVLNHWVRMLPRLIMLSMLILVLGSCAGTTTSDDLIPRSAIKAVGNQGLEGSVNVQASVPTRTSRPSYPQIMPISDWVDRNKVKVAVENTITQNGVFSRIDKGNVDYVLDVWVESVQTRLEVFGEGFIFDIVSIWRLTRAKDGKVLVCDFVKGHGGAHAVGSRAYPPALSAATQDMIQRGLSILLDQSEGHMSAFSIAGYRSSMGPVVPAGYTEWVGKVNRNWSKLKMSLTIDEVEEFIGPVRKSGAITEQYTKGATEGYTTSIYTLVFINGKLSRWELLRATTGATVERGQDQEK